MLGTSDVKGRRSISHNLLLQLGNFTRQLRGVLIETVYVQGDARHFHICQDADKGHFNFSKDLVYARLCKLGFKVLFELEGYVRIFASVFHNLLYFHVAHGLLIFALLANELLNGLRLVSQIRLRQHVHVVAHIGLQ